MPENKEIKAALFDLDGTLVEAHLWVGLSKYNFKNRENVLSTLSYLMSHMGLMIPWKMNLMSSEYFFETWIKDMAQLIKGTRADKSREKFAWLADRYLLPTLRKESADILKKHQREGFVTILISGSLQPVLDQVAERLGFDFAVGTEPEISRGRYTGRIVPPCCSGPGKLAKTEKLLAEKKLRINYEESYAYADSSVDLPILNLVGHPFAVDPDEKLRKIALAKGWDII